MPLRRHGLRVVGEQAAPGEPVLEMIAVLGNERHARRGHVDPVRTFVRIIGQPAPEQRSWLEYDDPCGTGGQPARQMIGAGSPGKAAPDDCDDWSGRHSVHLRAVQPYRCGHSLTH